MEIRLCPHDGSKGACPPVAFVLSYGSAKRKLPIYVSMSRLSLRADCWPRPKKCSEIRLFPARRDVHLNRPGIGTVASATGRDTARELLSAKHRMQDEQTVCGCFGSHECGCTMSARATREILCIERPRLVNRGTQRRSGFWAASLANREIVGGVVC